MSIHNYPPDIQEEYFKTHERMDVSDSSKKVVLTKSFGLLLFTCILLVCSLIAGAKTFLEGFLLAFGLMVWIGMYDTFFLDWVLFANMKIFRLEGTEHMDKAYHQKWFHLKGMLFPGLVFGLIPSLLVGLCKPPDWECIRHLYKIGIIAAILVLAGDMLLGWQDRIPYFKMYVR